MLDHAYHNIFRTSVASPILKNTEFSDTTSKEDVPNPTKHHQKMFGTSNYTKGKKNHFPQPPTQHQSRQQLVRKHHTQQSTNKGRTSKNIQTIYHRRTKQSHQQNEKESSRARRTYNRLLQRTRNGGKHKFLDIANEIYLTGHFPKTWKQAIMLPILKKDKPDKDPALYRPISLLPVRGKIVEALILIRFNNHKNQRNLTPCSQTGFRPG